LEPVDRSVTSRTLGGQTYTWQRDPYDRITVEFRDVTDAQKTETQTLADYVGTHTPWFFYMEGIHDTPVYVKFAELPRYQNSGGVSGAYYWDTELLLEEQI
jgi:hypothetical protein